MRKQNSLLTVKPTLKNGRTYYNFVVNAVLENGKEVQFYVKPSFYNRKFDRLLKSQLPRFGGGENEAK